MKRLALLLTCVTLSACTTIDRVNVNTVAINCDVQRGDAKSGRGSADADLIESAGQGAAEFVGALRSTIVCRDGTMADAEVHGEVRDD